MIYKINYEELTVERDLSDLSDEDKYELEIEGDSIIYKFNNVIELIAFILPDEFYDHKNFKALSAEFLATRLPEDAWLPIEVYAIKNNISRQSVYLRQKKGLVEIEKIDRKKCVRDIQKY